MEPDEDLFLTDEELEEKYPSLWLLNTGEDEGYFGTNYGGALW